MYTLHANLFDPLALANTESGKSAQHSTTSKDHTISLTTGVDVSYTYVFHLFSFLCQESNQYMNLNIKSSLLSFDIAFVNKSARFVAVSSFVTLIIPAATASRHR